MRHLDLFSGIGGFALAAHWAGYTTEVFCERDEYCTKILKKHWPDVPVVGDIFDMHFDDAGNFFSIDHKGGVMGRKRQSKYDCCVDLYERGMSVGECADLFGITRQAMHKILTRRGASFRSNLNYGEENHFFRGGSKGSRKVRGFTERAINKGILVPQPCEVCGETGSFSDGRRKVQAHHDDYSKPLVVRWLCQHHHHEWHKTNTAKGESGEPATGEGVIDLLTGGFP
jgi:predicted transcriptional regulator